MARPLPKRPHAAITALEQIARQIGINAFWLEWDEAGHFELDDDDETIADVVLNPWHLGPGIWSFSAFHALPREVRRLRELRLAAPRLHELAYDSFGEMVQRARKRRSRLPRKAPLVLELEGRSTVVKWVADPARVVRQEVRITSKPRPAPTSVWGHSLARRREVDVEDRLFEELVGELGKPSRLVDYYGPIGTATSFVAEWRSAKVYASVHRAGLAVTMLATRSAPP